MNGMYLTFWRARVKLEAALPAVAKFEVELVAIRRFWIAGLDWASFPLLHLCCCGMYEELVSTPKNVIDKQIAQH